VLSVCDSRGGPPRGRWSRFEPRASLHPPHTHHDTSREARQRGGGGLDAEDPEAQALLHVAAANVHIVEPHQGRELPLPSDDGMNFIIGDHLDLQCHAAIADVDDHRPLHMPGSQGPSQVCRVSLLCRSYVAAVPQLFFALGLEGDRELGWARRSGGVWGGGAVGGRDGSSCRDRDNCFYLGTQSLCIRAGVVLFFQGGNNAGTRVIGMNSPGLGQIQELEMGEGGVVDGCGVSVHVGRCCAG
jgi:hypothetical protein